MNSLPTILLCLASGAVGAGATNFLISPSTDQSADVDVATLEEMIADMKSENAARDAMLRDQADMLERMDSEAQLVGFTPERIVVPEATTSEASTSASADLNAPIKLGDTQVTPAQFRALVQQANDTIRAEEQAKRAEERKIREGERVEERVTALTTELGLDSHQQSEFRRHFEEQNIKRSDLMAAMREGTIDRGDMRDAWGEIREAANTDLQSFLSGSQYETYQKSDNNDSNRFGRRGGGNRGGNNTGGGNNGGGNNAGGGRRRGGN